MSSRRGRSRNPLVTPTTRTRSQEGKTTDRKRENIGKERDLSGEGGRMLKQEIIEVNEKVQQVLY